MVLLRVFCELATSKGFQSSLVTLGDESGKNSVSFSRDRVNYRLHIVTRCLISLIMYQSSFVNEIFRKYERLNDVCSWLKSRSAVPAIADNYRKVQNL